MNAKLDAGLWKWKKGISEWLRNDPTSDPFEYFVMLQNLAPVCSIQLKIS